MNGSRGMMSNARNNRVFQAPNPNSDSAALVIRAQRSEVEGSRIKIQGNATGFLDFARNDDDDARSTYSP
jgi:hypothetical protein